MVFSIGIYLDIAPEMIGTLLLPLFDVLFFETLLLDESLAYTVEAAEVVETLFWDIIDLNCSFSASIAFITYLILALASYT